MQACIFSHFPRKTRTDTQKFERVTLARVPERLVHFGRQLVARGRGRAGVSRRSARARAPVQHHSGIGGIGGDPLIQRGVWGAAFNGVAGVLSALNKKIGMKKTEVWHGVIITSHTL